MGNVKAISLEHLKLIEKIVLSQGHCIKQGFETTSRRRGLENKKGLWKFSISP